MTVFSNIKSAGEVFWFGNTLILIKTSSRAGQDGLCVIEHWMPYGDSPPMHVHRNEDELFFILEGEVRFIVDGQEKVGRVGDSLLAPKGLPHSYCVESRDGARMLTVTRGADFENMLRLSSRPSQRFELPTRSAPTPAVIDALVATCAANGIDIVGTPLQPKTF